MLLGAQRIARPAVGNAMPATDAAQRAELSAAGNGASTAAAGDNATRSSKGNWRSLGGGAQPLAASANQQRGQDGASQSSGGADGPVVLDVRNGYEWDAGHFQGAERPLEVGCVGAVSSTMRFESSRIAAGGK